MKRRRRCPAVKCISCTSPSGAAGAAAGRPARLSRETWLSCAITSAIWLTICTDGAVVIALAQQGNHTASETAHLAVRKDGFEPIADLGPVLVVVRGEQDHHATVRPLVPHAPLLEKVIGEVFHRVTFQSLDRDHRDLSLGFLIDLRTHLGKFLHRRRVEYAGKVVDVPLGVELFPLFRMDSRNRNDGQKYDEQREWAATGAHFEAAGNRPHYSASPLIRALISAICGLAFWNCALAFSANDFTPAFCLFTVPLALALTIMPFSFLRGFGPPSSVFVKKTHPPATRG